MSEYVLTCSSTADLPKEYTEEHHIGVIPYHFYLDGKEYLDDQGESISVPDFYNKMREGGMPSTSMVNMDRYLEFFRPYLEEGKDILHLEFSGGLSGTLHNAERAAKQLMGEFPDRMVKVVDTLSASRGYGLLVYLTEEQKQQGATLDEAAAYAERMKKKITHWLAVESLEYLRRGGRVSRASAFLGTMMNIKPVLAFNNEGKIIPVEKIRGRRKSLQAMVDKMEKDVENNAEGQVVFIGHADAPEDAKWLEEEVRGRFPGVKDVLVHYTGPVIGAHSGPGTVNLHYIGKERIDTEFK